MNTTKATDKIILVLAAIAIAPGILLGGNYAIRHFKQLTPEYSEYIKDPSAWNAKQDYIPKKYSETAAWKRKASATIGGVQGFLIVYIGLNWLKNLFFWIADRFKDKYKDKSKQAFEDFDSGRPG
jgi:hypothetical protein